MTDADTDQMTLTQISITIMRTQVYAGTLIDELL